MLRSNHANIYVADSQTTSSNSNGTNSVLKVNNSTEGAAPSAPSTTASGPVTPFPLSVSQATFPGMPAVRLVGDCNFLHRLLLFCFLFRKRPLPRLAQAAAPRNSDGDYQEPILT